MLQTKALYNLLRLKKEEDPTVEVDSWVMEDLRQVSVNDLFFRLEQSGIKIDKRSFCEFAYRCDSPEELADLLFPDGKNAEEKDPLYLICFELWRKLLPEKQSLSIFCDELDHQINLYDDDQLESDENIQDALANLLDILEENIDEGAKSKEIFKVIKEFCAHDIESFIYDYIFELLDHDNIIYASELVEGFTRFAQEPLWFDFLRIRLLSHTDISLANVQMHRLLENELDLELLLEMIQFLSTIGEHELFKVSVQKALPKIRGKEEFMDVMSMIADYYRGLDEDDKEKKIQELLLATKKGKLSSRDLQTLNSLIG